jgi:hypothetical protein
VLLPEELDRDLQGVMTIVNDHTFATAFLIDPQGDFITAASAVDGSASLRLVDNTGGSHAVRLIGIDADLGIALVRASNDGIPLAFGDPAALQVDDPVVLLASPKVVNLRTATPAVVLNRSDTQLTLRLDDLPGNLGGPVVGPGGKVVGILIASGRALPLVTIQGSGFTDGKMLRIQFVPLASPNGGFDGLAATFVNPSTLTVKVPAGRVVQDYIVQVTNGDGTVTSSRIAFTITP